MSYWGGWGRTSNLPVNSRALCLLSYTPSSGDGHGGKGEKVYSTPHAEVKRRRLTSATATRTLDILLLPCLA